MGTAGPSMTNTEPSREDLLREDIDRLLRALNNMLLVTGTCVTNPHSCCRVGDREYLHKHFLAVVNESAAVFKDCLERHKDNPKDSELEYL